MTKYKQDFEKCVSKIQKTPDAYKLYILSIYIYNLF